MHRAFTRYGRWLVGAASVASVSIGVAHMSSPSASTWTPTKPTNIPDGYSKWDYNWDKREPYTLMKPPKKSKSTGDGGDKEQDSEPEVKRNKAARHIILIRHGQYNMKGDKDSDHSLTSLGESQANLTGIRLNNSGITFDSFTASTMTRAIQTADIIQKEMDQKNLCIYKDPILEEGSPCLPEPPISSWRPDQHYYEDGARIEAAFRKYFHRADPEQEHDSFEIIVCHANVIRFFICRALQFPPEAWLRISLKNCSLTMLSITPSGRVILRSLGDSGHIPIDKTTTT